MQWSYNTSDTARRIGARAIDLLADHDNGAPFSATETHLIARACALAADEVLMRRAVGGERDPHDGGGPVAPADAARGATQIHGRGDAEGQGQRGSDR
jgi:hypothetical protein